MLHAKLVCGLILITILAGALVAGLDAGLVYNMFPLMGGKIVPEDYLAMEVIWRNIFENPAAVQFNHRLFGTATALAIAWLLFRCLRLNTTAAARTAAYSLSALVILQFSLGVLSLTNWVPIT